MIGLAVLLVSGFAGLWPTWLMAATRWLAGSVLALVLAFAILLGAILAFLLIVRPRR